MVSNSLVEELKQIRNMKEAKLKPSPFITGKIRAFDGSIVDCSVRNYQSIGILNLMKMTEFVLGDEPGLGKTLQVLYAYAYLRHWYPNLKLLWVGPKSSLQEKLDEVRVMLNHTRAIYVSSDLGKAGRHQAWKQVRYTGIEVAVCNYNTVMTDYQQIEEAYRDYQLMIVLDEAHTISNINTKTHKACKFISKNALRRVAITATVIKNRLMEAYGIFKYTAPDIFPSKLWFESMFCSFGTEFYGRTQITVLKGYQNLDLFRRMIGPYFIGRTPDDVGGELPEVTPRKVLLQMEGEQAKRYDQCVSGLFTKKVKDPLTGEDTQVPVQGALRILMSSMIITNALQMIPEYESLEEYSSKEKRILDYLKGDLQDEKVVIFSFFKKWVYRLKGIIEKETGKKVLLITGDQGDTERQQAKNLFNGSPDHNIILITLAGSQSINLTAARYMIFANLPWSYGDFRQIVGRISRLGSKHESVIALMLINEKSVDEHVFSTLQSKQNLSRSLFKDSMPVMELAESDSSVNDIVKRLQQSSRS